jgi:hypothetical protein
MQGAGAIVISRGSDGLLAVTEEGVWQAAPRGAWAETQRVPRTRPASHWWRGSWTDRRGPSAWLTRWHCGRSRALAGGRLV